MCQASRPHIRNRLARTIPSPYSAARVRKNTSSSRPHWSTENWTWKTSEATTRTTAARVALITRPPMAIPNSTLITSIGAAK